MCNQLTQGLFLAQLEDFKSVILILFNPQSAIFIKNLHIFVASLLCNLEFYIFIIRTYINEPKKLWLHVRCNRCVASRPSRSQMSPNYLSIRSTKAFHPFLIYLPVEEESASAWNTFKSTCKNGSII